MRMSCYDANDDIKRGDLLISLQTDFGLTRGRIYIAEENKGYGTFHDCVFVKNDNDELLDYSTEFFCKYDGEIVSI